MWGWISYDPELEPDLLRHRRIPGPWNPEQRPGDNKWTCGIFARDPDTGEARLVLPDAARTTCTTTTASTRTSCSTCRSNGQPRKVLVHPERNGYVYVIDRATGEVLSADAVRLHQHDARASTSKTGRLQSTPEKDAAGRARSCATSARPRPGAKDWQPSAFSPQHRAALHPAPEPVHGLRGRRGELHRRHAVRRRERADVRRARAAIAASSRAWDPVHAQAGLEHQGELPGLERRARRPPATSSSTARWTAGSRRSTRTTGELLWQFKTGSGIIGQPITYAGPTASSTSRSSPASAAGPARSSPATSIRATRTAALGFVNAMTRPAAAHDQGRDAVCVRAAMSAALARSPCSLPRCSLARAPAPAARAARDAARLRRPEQPAVLERRRRRVREPDRRADRRASSARTRRLHLVGAAPRLRPQHAEGRAVRRRASGVPSGFEHGLRRRAPYYRSTYVFVTAQDRRLRHHARSTIRALRDAADRRAADRRRRRQHAAGARARPAAASSTTSRGYTVYGDYAQPNPPARIVEAVAQRRGRRRGRLGAARRLLRAARSRCRCDIVPVTPQVDVPFLPLIFDIAMGVRRERRRRCATSSTRSLARRQPEIDAILARVRRAARRRADARQRR